MTENKELPEETDEERIEGLRLTGEYVKTLNDKNFQVMKIQKITIHDERTDKDKEVYEYTIKLTANESIRAWIPGQKAKQAMADKWGDKFNDQLGKKAEFYTVVQNVFGKQMDVVYVK